jgi:hypothetical protein
VTTRLPGYYGEPDYSAPPENVQRPPVDYGEPEFVEEYHPPPQDLRGGGQGRGDLAVLPYQPNTVRWGDKKRLIFEVGPRSEAVTDQLLQVKFIRPMICSIRLTATVRFPGPLSELDVTSLDLYVGVGSSQQKITRSWLAQPNRLGDLDVIIPDVPVTTLLAEISCVGTAVEGQMVVVYNLALAPTVQT